MSRSVRNWLAVGAGALVFLGILGLPQQLEVTDSPPTAFVIVWLLLAAVTGVTTHRWVRRTLR